MMKKQHYMTRDERQQLEAMYRNKIPVIEMARQLGFCRQTIYNELKQGAYQHDCNWRTVKRYSADRAQTIHQQRQSVKGRPLKIGNDHAYANYLERLMLGNGDKRKRYSPAAALAAARAADFSTSISVATLYSYIDQRVFLHLSNKDLWEKSKRKTRTYQSIRRIAHPALPSIINRPSCSSCLCSALAIGVLPGGIDYPKIIRGFLDTIQSRNGMYLYLKIHYANT